MQPRRHGRRALLALAASAGMAAFLGPSGAHAAVGSELAPIKGVAYQPAPSDYLSGAPAYYDTDFFNSDFTELWSSSGRGDLREMAQALGANMVRLYNWNPARDHLSFLNEAHRLGLRVAVPISNYFVQVDPQAAQHIADIVRQVYVDEQGRPSTTPHPAVVMWTVGNEMDLAAENPLDADSRRKGIAKVAQATASLVVAETGVNASRRLPVSSPVSFAAFDRQPAAFDQTRMVLDALNAHPALGPGFVSSRYIAAANTFNPGADLRQWLTSFSTTFPNLSVWFTEIGINTSASCNGFPRPCTEDDDQQAAYIAAQWREAPPGTAGVHLGGAFFEWQNEPWKGGTEATFGLTKFADPPQFRTVGGYRVDTLVHKPAWDAFRDPVNGVRLLTGSRARVEGLAIDDNDVVALDEATGQVSRRFDGDRAGMPAGAAITAVTTDPRDDSLVLAFSGTPKLPGAGRVGPSDVVAFRGGTFKTLLRGSGPPVDAVAMTRTGRLVVSVARAGRVAGVAARPQDLIEPKARRVFLRGAAAGLTTRTENVDGAWIDPQGGDVHLSTTGAFRADGVRGTGADVLIYDRASDAVRLGWRARAAGATGAGLEGVSIVR